MFSLWIASSFTSRNIDSAPLALALMPIHYWVALRASQENWPKISVPFIPVHDPFRRHVISREGRNLSSSSIALRAHVAESLPPEMHPWAILSAFPVMMCNAKDHHEHTLDQAGP